MLTGSLWISRVMTGPETYRLVLVPYDSTPPSTVTVSTVYALRSFLASVGLPEDIREAVIEQATWRGLAVLKSVQAEAQGLEQHAA